MTSPIAGWDQRVYAGLESAYGTRVLPVAADALSFQNLDFGPAPSTGQVRPRKDKTQGRDMTLGFVEGRVDPIAASLDKPVMSRASATTAPEESAILRAAGFSETIGGASVDYAIGTSLPSTLWLLSVLGAGSAALEAEHGLGGVVKSISFSGGDSELMMKAALAFQRKTFLGQSTGTLADDTDTSLALATAAEAYRFSEGYLQMESEILEASATDYASGLLTVERGLGGSTAAAHAAKTLYPYNPNPAPVGVEPISEAECTVTLDGIATQCTKFGVDITTGVDHLPGATGSRYAPGSKLIRMDVKVSLDLILTDALIAMFGKANQRKTCALTIVCGTAAGGIVTFSLPYCEIEDFPVPAPSNDVSAVSPSLRVRGDTGNDMLSISFS